MQHPATHYNPLQHAVTRCNTLQHAATRCITHKLSCIIPNIQRRQDRCGVIAPMTRTRPVTCRGARLRRVPKHQERSECVAVYCSVLPHVAGGCGVLQGVVVAVCCSMLQWVLVCCCVLQLAFGHSTNLVECPKVKSDLSVLQCIIVCCSWLFGTRPTWLSAPKSRAI